MVTRRDILSAAVSVLLVSSQSRRVAGQQASAQKAAEPTAFGLAVVRTSGLLVPIGWFNGTAWDATWPEPGRQVETPATLADIPKAWMPAGVPAQWHLWLFDDPMVRTSPFEPTQARPVTVLAPVRYHAHCVIAVGLKTDFSAGDGTSLRNEDEPGSLAGLALTQADTRVEPIVTVDPASELGKWVTARAITKFNRAEDAALETEDPQTPRLPGGPQRQKTAITWSKILRRGVAQGAVKTYYLEGEKDYGKNVSGGHIWLQFDRDREILDGEVEVTDPSRMGATHRHPLGVIRVDEREFWILQARHYESEDYEVFELKGSERPPRVVLSMSGGGC
jgi:hypothetical protein